MRDDQPFIPGLIPEEPLPSHCVISRGKEVPIAQRNYMDLYWQFIFERQMVWYKRFKLGMPPPWTEDDILRNYKFTNMYRELDRGTMYLLDNIIGRVDVFGPAKAQVFNTIMYRVFNRVETWDVIKALTHVHDPENAEMPWDRGRMFEILRHRQDVEGLPLYTDAHMVCAYNGTPGKDKLARIEHIFNKMETEMDKFFDLVMSCKSLETIWKALKDMHGLGPFLAYEIAVDISYAPWNNHNENEWVNPGPGCQVGINIIFPDTKPKDCTRKIFELRDMQQDEFQRLGLPFQSIAYKSRWLTLRNIEHDLCEFQKYVKALNGTGRPRNKFRPKAQRGGSDFARLGG